jgi:hypothetical protein
MSCPETDNDPHGLRRSWPDLNASMYEAGMRAAQRLAEEIERLIIGSIGVDKHDSSVADHPPES